MQFYVGGTTLLGTVSASPWTYTWNSVANGSYSLTAMATASDTLTNTSSAVAITVATDTPPTVSITAPANGATYTAPASVSITATATASSGHTISSVKFYQGSTLLSTATTSPYSYNWTSVQAGSYSLTAVATDNLNVQTTSSAVGITVNSGSSGPPSGSMILWVKADTGVTTNSGNVTTWADQSGAGHTLTQNTSGCYPTLVSNDMNGLPGVRFSGSNSITDCIGYTGLGSTYTGAFTLYVVIQATTAQVCNANGGVDNRIFSGPTQSDADWDGGIDMETGTGSAFSTTIYTLTPTLAAGQYLNCMGLGGYYAPGGSNGGGWALTGDIGEVLLYNRTLSGSEQTQMTTYLTGRWN